MLRNIIFPLSINVVHGCNSWTLPSGSAASQINNLSSWGRPLNPRTRLANRLRILERNPDVGLAREIGGRIGGALLSLESLRRMRSDFDMFEDVKDRDMRRVGVDGVLTAGSDRIGWCGAATGDLCMS